MQLFITYESVNGGTNNLQVARVVSNSPYKGLVNVIKVFTSKRNMAKNRAEAFIKKYNK